MFAKKKCLCLLGNVRLVIVVVVMPMFDICCKPLLLYAVNVSLNTEYGGVPEHNFGSYLSSVHCKCSCDILRILNICLFQLTVALENTHCCVNDRTVATKC